MQIIVLGMHRSGTSAMTRLINMMGAYFGPEGSALPSNEDNPKGFWERRDFVLLNMHLLGARGCSWYDLSGWTATPPKPFDPRLSDGMKTFMLGLDAHRPWVLKDPRLCITLCDWLPLLDTPLVVVASRDPLEIARSLEQREGAPVAYGLALWEHYAVHIVRNAAALPKLFVAHQAVMSSPVTAAQGLYDGLVANGVRRLAMPSEREILGFIEPALHRARRADVTATLTPHQQALDAMLRGERAFDALVEVSAASRDLVKREAPAMEQRLKALAVGRGKVAS